MNILKNYNLKKKSNLVDGKLLETLFPIYMSINENTNFQKYKFDINEIIIPMYELKEKDVELYIKMNDNHIELDDLSTMITLNKYYKNSTNNRIVDILSNLNESSYWKDKKNCNFTMNDVFNKRILSFNGVRLDELCYSTIKGAKNLNAILDKLNTKNNDDNYMITELADNVNNVNNVNNKYKKKAEHMNIYEVLKTSENRTFYATMDDGQFKFTKESLADIFDRINDEKYRFHLLNSLLVSKDYCHFVVNNRKVLIRNADIFNKYKPLYMYLFGYAWLTMYLEESIFTTKSTRNHRFSFDLDTAHELPMFPFSMENIHHNPYLVLLLNSVFIDPKTNCMSINSLRNYKKYYGLCSKEEALKRINVFISGKSDLNIFDGIKNTKLAISISGSIMPACLQRFNPLFERCTIHEQTYDEKWNTFFTHYYGDSDVDVMCGTSSMIDFLKQASELLNIISKNLKKNNFVNNNSSNSNDEDLDYVIDSNKKLCVIIYKHFFSECLDDINEQLDIEYTKEDLINIFEKNIDINGELKIPENIKQYFYVDYVQEKNELNKKFRKYQKKFFIDIDIDIDKDKDKDKDNIKIKNRFTESYNCITSIEDMNFRLSTYDMIKNRLIKKDSEMYFFVNDFRSIDNKVPKDKNYLVFKFAESIKYKVKFSNLKKQIEIFKIEPTDPFNTVARFHKPCVRAYFDLKNEQIYMLPSFITSMMSMINIDYKYFAGSRDPIEIINKYLMRGYSVILNPNEKKSMLIYNKNIDKDKGMFRIEKDSELFGPKNLNDKIFKPGVYKLGLSEDFYKIDNNEYINNIKDLEQVYKSECYYDNTTSPINILQFTVINKDGYINPLKLWISHAVYDYINS